MAVHRLTTTLNSGATRCEVKPALERSRPVSSQDSEQAIVEFWGLFRAKSGIDGPRKRSAGGILSFHMEKQGAEVVSFDLDKDGDWDMVPFAKWELACPQTF